jgi:hypothetical protein
VPPAFCDPRYTATNSESPCFLLPGLSNTPSVCDDIQNQGSILNGNPVDDSGKPEVVTDQRPIDKVRTFKIATGGGAVTGGAIGLATWGYMLDSVVVRPDDFSAPISVVPAGLMPKARRFVQLRMNMKYVKIMTLGGIYASGWGLAIIGAGAGAGIVAGSLVVGGALALGYGFSSAQASKDSTPTLQGELPKA